MYFFKGVLFKDVLFKDVLFKDVLFNDVLLKGAGRWHACYVHGSVSAFQQQLIMPCVYLLRKGIATHTAEDHGTGKNSYCTEAWHNTTSFLLCSCSAAATTCA